MIRAPSPTAGSPGALPELHPLGTARQRLDPQPALPAEVAALLANADAGPETSFLTWQISSWAEELGPADRSRFARLVASSLIAGQQGSTRVPVSEDDAELLSRLPGLVGPPGARQPFVLESSRSGRYLYQHRHHASEQRIAAALRARVRPGQRWPGAQVDAALASAASASGGPTLSDEQREAVRSVLGQGLGVITGGPGTGKTTIVVALVRAFLALGVPAREIALAAPTGKAAGRLDEALEAAGLATGPEPSVSLGSAQTLHRLLGYSPSARAFAHHRQSPLPQRVVIVDEASMVDLFLIDALLDALTPETALVLIGDADQLPSVEAGAVFRDLSGRAVRLEQSHRLDPAHPQARRILELAAGVRAGASAGALLSPQTPESLLWQGPELVSPEAREALLERWYRDFVATSPDASATRFSLESGGLSPEAEQRLDALLSHHQRHKLLAATRARPTGSIALNDWMHARWGASGAQPIPGEPVIVLRNDYDRGLWNGDQGVVIELEEPRRAPRPAAAFKVRGRWTAYTLESLRDTLGLAFALTVHKAQGSEYDHVALVLPEVPIPLVSRELLYTALTRSRQSVTVCASREVVQAAVAATASRSSGISEKLSAAE